MTLRRQARAVAITCRANLPSVCSVGSLACLCRLLRYQASGRDSSRETEYSLLIQAADTRGFLRQGREELRHSEVSEEVGKDEY